MQTSDERWLSIFETSAPLESGSAVHYRVYQLFSTIDGVAEGYFKPQSSSSSKQSCGLALPNYTRMEVAAASYKEIVSSFARLGAKIIQTDPRSHYEVLGKNAQRPMEPGYIPINCPPLLTTISYYPNATELPSSEFQTARDGFRRWGQTGTLEDYETAYHGWQSFREQIPFYRRWEEPLFKALGLRSEETAWIPLVKCPLPAKTRVDTDSIDVARDLGILWDQLLLLKPTLILVQGAVVYDVVGARLDNLKFVRAHPVQKIPQYPKADMLKEQLDTLVQTLKPEIDRLRAERNDE